MNKKKVFPSWFFLKSNTCVYVYCKVIHLFPSGWGLLLLFVNHTNQGKKKMDIDTGPENATDGLFYARWITRSLYCGVMPYAFARIKAPRTDYQKRALYPMTD